MTEQECAEIHHIFRWFDSAGNLQSLSYQMSNRICDSQIVLFQDSYDNVWVNAYEILRKIVDGEEIEYIQIILPSYDGFVISGKTICERISEDECSE